MKKSKGQRQGTRSILRRGRHQRGRVNISRIMHDYAEGDRVAIVLDGGQQMGMPHRRFQGRTGFIQGRQGKAWVVFTSALSVSPSFGSPVVLGLTTQAIPIIGASHSA